MTLREYFGFIFLFDFPERSNNRICILSSLSQFIQSPLVECSSPSSLPKYLDNEFIILVLFGHEDQSCAAGVFGFFHFWIPQVSCI